MTTLLALLVEGDGGDPVEVAEHVNRTIEALNKQRAGHPSRQVSYGFRAGALRLAQVVEVPEGLTPAEREIAVVLRRDFDETLLQARADVAREVLQAVMTSSAPGTTHHRVQQVAEQYGVTL